MESAPNSSDSDYCHFPLFCHNFTDSSNNTTGADRRGHLSDLGNDTNPVIIAIVITALYSIVCVVGLVGNVLVMYIIVSQCLCYQCLSDDLNDSSSPERATLTLFVLKLTGKLTSRDHD
uniref:Uncharacterized protein n=1 Tax=Knipowitschia caucasica TaxID=637954 RepID=A0AAV2JRG7_KNICA